MEVTQATNAIPECEPQKIIPQNSPFLNEKSRHRETPAAPKLPAFLCACFLVKGLREFKPTDEADEDFFFGEYGYSFNHPVHQGVGILRKVEIFCGDEGHDFLDFISLTLFS